MGDLIKVSKEELQQRYDARNGQWLYNIARGIDLEAIVPRLVSKSIGCCKKFPGRNAITAIGTLNHWLSELAQEIGERLEQDEEENNRRPKQMVVSFIQDIRGADVSSSRSVNLTTIEQEKIAADALDVLKRNTEKFFKTPDNQSLLNNPIKFLGLNVGKFENIDTKRTNTIQNMFQRTIDSKKAEIIANVDEGEKKEVDGIDEKSETGTEAQTSKESAKDDSNLGFFARYRIEKLEREKVEAEAAKLAEQQRQEECSDDENDDSRDKFDNEWLQAELDNTTQVDGDHEASTTLDTMSMVTESTVPKATEPIVSTAPAKHDYTMTYAEFYCPAPPKQLPKIKCDQCGKMINEPDIQVHQDAHYAYQISQEQRTEYQNQLKRTIPAPATPVALKKPKTTNAKVQTPVKMPSIQQFLKKSEETEVIASTSHTADDDLVKCDECGKVIHTIDLLEHTDFHAAQKLHDEMMRADMANRMNNNSNAITTKTGSTTKTTKTKKKAAGKCKSNAKTKRNISSFFQSKDD